LHFQALLWNVISEVRAKANLTIVTLPARASRTSDFLLEFNRASLEEGLAGDIPESRRPRLACQQQWQTGTDVFAHGHRYAVSGNGNQRDTHGQPFAGARTGTSAGKLRKNRESVWSKWLWEIKPALRP
jgi:hypothetical protein